MARHIVRLIGLVWMLCILTACASPAVIREPVTVVQRVYVSIPANLTTACPVAKPRNNSGDELLRVTRERRRALEVCNGQLEAIRRIQGSEAP